MHGLLYTIGVGFCVARSDLMGSAKASKSGMSDEYRLPRFFYVLLSNVISQALESRLVYIIMYMSTRELNALLLLLGLSLPAMAQSVDYSIVAVGEESGLDFKKITSDNDCLCMPEVKRRGKKITWWSGRVISMSPTEEKLAFLSYKTNNSNIYLKNLTGAGTTQQRTNRQQVIDFSYSPDGQKICFTEKNGSSNRIFITDANKGYGCRQVTANEFDFSPSYNADMSQILFCRKENSGSFGIWNYQFNDNSFSNFTSGFNAIPVPNTTDILCVRSSGIGNNEIWRINTETGVEECIVSEGNRSFTSPTISPDGKWILMVGSSMKVVDVAGQNNPNKVYPNTDIFVCHIDGSNLTQITYHAADDLSPVWSKDGKYIYFVSQRGSSTQTANVWRIPFMIKN